MPKGEKVKLLWADPEYRKRMVEVHKGKKQSKETIEKRVAQFRGEKNWNWKGDAVSYSGMHYWIKRELGRPNECEQCSKIGRNMNGRWNIEWASKSRKYKRNLFDWMGLCKKCHWKYDDVSNKIWKTRRLKQANAISN